MTLDTSGNLLVGTTTTRLRLTVSGLAVAAAPSLGTASGTAFFANSDPAYGLMLGSSGGGQSWMQVQRTDGSATAYDLWVQPSGGNLLVGTTSSASVSARVNGIALKTAGTADIRNSVGWNFGTSGSSGIHLYFYTDNGSTFVTAGQINSNGSTTAYVTSSDYRLKENVQPLTNALGQVSQLRPVVWKWKDGVGGTNPNGQGFIAHELQEVVPDCVTGEKDAVDAEGKPEYQGIDTSFLVATLVAAIQELTARLEVLENK
jgi:hypothetical protein